MQTDSRINQENKIFTHSISRGGERKGSEDLNNDRLYPKY